MATANHPETTRHREAGPAVRCQTSRGATRQSPRASSARPEDVTTGPGPQGYDLTEATNASVAHAVATDYQDVLCFVRSADKSSRSDGWLHYEGGVWTHKGAEKAALEAVEQTVRDLLKALPDREPDHDKLKVRQRELLNALNRLPHIKTVASYLMARDLAEFDTDRYLLNVQNGTLDLAYLNPKLRDEHPVLFHEHQASDLCTKQAGVAYDPNAPTPTR
jgi:hypothetical protein